MSADRWDRRLDVKDHAVPERYRAMVDDGLGVADSETPASILEAKEGGGELTEPQRRMAVRVRQFVLFGEFISVGVDELVLLKMRSLIMLRTCAPGLLRERYKLTQAQALTLERRLWGATPYDYRQRDYVPLSVSLAAHADEDEEWCAGELTLTVPELRILRFGQFCEQISVTARDIDAFAKTAASVLRRVKTQFVAGLGASQADFGRKFGEGRATVQAREKRSIEAPMKASGQHGYKLLGGTKSEGHREACQKAQKGNTNRRDSSQRRHAS